MTYEELHGYLRTSMGWLYDRVFDLLQDPRVADLMRHPRAQALAVKAVRARGRVEGALHKRVQRVASGLDLATQKDVRALHRRVRHLEEALRETEERIIAAEDAGAARARS